MSAFGGSGLLRRLIPLAFLLLSTACATPVSLETSPETTGSGGAQRTDSPASDSGSRTSGAAEKHVLITLQLTPGRAGGTSRAGLAFAALALLLVRTRSRSSHSRG